MRKKSLLIVLVLCLVLAVVPAFVQAAQTEEEFESFQSVGIDFALSQAAEDIDGLLMYEPVGPIDRYHTLYAMLFFYLALPGEEAAWLLTSPTATAEEEALIDDSMAMLSVLLATSNDDLGSIEALFSERIQGQYTLKLDEAEKIGSADGYTFYSIPIENEEYFSRIDEEYAAECDQLIQKMTEAEKAGILYAPVDKVKEMSGQKLSFTTTDLDGNTVTSEELFSENEITMINCWGMWCVKCMNEMDELAQIHARMQEKGCGIVGLEYEQYWDDATAQAARQVLKEYGIDYPNAILPEELRKQLFGYPTSIFVDREGTILGVPISGADVNGYESMLDELLEERGTDS